MVEYLYGFGGCVCEDGDNSGDEEEDDAMAKETEKAEEKECCVRRRCGLQVSTRHHLATITTNTCQLHSAIPDHPIPRTYN
jgi:hypothetical protein